MTTQPETVREKILRLRTSFMEQLPERIRQAREQMHLLYGQPDNLVVIEELHRFFHGIKGTGRSFGMRELGVAAAQAESWTARLLESPEKRQLADWMEQMEKYFDLLTSMGDKSALSLSSMEAAPSAWQAESMPQDISHPERRIYLCDDDPLILEQLSYQLQCFGFKMETFRDPEEFLAAVRTHPPDAAIMDIIFPDDPDAGTNAMAALQSESGAHIPTIFLSGRSDFAARLAAVRAGGDAYFLKPVRAMDLVSVLDTVTAKQHSDPFRILVVDDEPTLAEYHALILQEAGMVTRCLHEPTQILNQLREFRSDLVLMDMYMPTCHGQELARIIRQIPDYVGLPIVFLSGETDRKKQDSAMRIGAEGFITKPVIPEALISAVTIRAERMRSLRALMTRDSLTGLFNHTTTAQMLDNAMANAQRQGDLLCFCMIDIDRFKSVNDTHGHPVGDQVIMALARILQQRLRHSDVVGRFGGEEFAVILHNVSPERAARLINILRLDFSRVQFHSTRGSFTCTFSAGIASLSRHPHSDALREAADNALYQAKNSGRNRVVIEE